MFNKNVIIGVSVTPEVGLEVAQIDYATGTVRKYGRKSIDYNIVKREITDLDVFKESLDDMLQEMNIQKKGTELVINMPTVAYKISDFPAAIDNLQMEVAIEEELYDNPYLRNYEPCYGYNVISSTLQSRKVAYSALQRAQMIELVMSLKDQGYKVRAIDTSINSVLHSLVYLDMVNTDPDTNWLLLTIDKSCCRIMSMMGKHCVDIYEEKISIGEVLSDAENYATVIAAIEPLLRNLPAKYLCIVSKTNVISAEVISNKINYSAPIVYQEANCYNKEPFLNYDKMMVDEDFAKTISLDVIGAAIYGDYARVHGESFNLYNKTLGEIFLMDQPPVLPNGLVLTNSLLYSIGILFIAACALCVFGAMSWFAVQNKIMDADKKRMNDEIAILNKFLNDNKNISSNEFDEGDQIRNGLTHNKNIYSYYTIVGTDIPKKLWLTHLKLGDFTTIEGQADNIESVYAFFRSIKDYNPDSKISLQKLGLAGMGPRELNDEDAESILTTLNADFYEFKISNEIERKLQKPASDDANGNPSNVADQNNTTGSTGTPKASDLPVITY